MGYRWTGIFLNKARSKKLRLDTTMNKASYKGHRDIVELMLEKGAIKYDRTMEKVAYGGHRDIVELMLEKGVVVVGM